MQKIYFTLLSVLIWGLTTLAAQTGSVYPFADALVDSQFPDSTIDQSAVNGNLLTFRRYEAGEAVSRVESLVSFSLAGLNGQQVENAALTFRGKVNEEAFAGDFILELYEARDAYDPATVTAATAPRRGQRLGSVPLTTSSARQPFANEGNRLVDYLNAQVLAGATEARFYLRSAGGDSTASMFIGGADNGSFAPILEYTVTPQISKYSLGDAVTDSSFPDSVVDQTALNGNLLAYREYGPDGNATSRVQAYVLFDISDLNGRQVAEVDLSIRGKVNEEEFADDFVLELRSLRDPLIPDSTTADNEPRSRRTLGTLALNTNSARRSFVSSDSEFLDYINDASLNGATEIGFLIRSTGGDSTNSMFIGGTDNGSFGPILNYRITPTVSQYSIADAVTDSAFPDSIIDQSALNDNILAYREYTDGTATSRVQSFVKFDISGLNGRRVANADFSLRGKVNEEEFANDFVLELRSLRDPFDADSTTASNEPRSRRTLGTVALTTDSGRQSFVNSGDELVTYLNEASLNGETEISFLIRSTGGDSTSSMFIGGTANGSFGPILNYELSSETAGYGLGDAVVFEEFPDSVADQTALNGNLLAFRDYGEDETFRTQSYVKFDLSGLVGQTLETADFSFRGKVNEEEFANDFSLELRGIRDDFNADSLTWNSIPRQGNLLGTADLDTDSGRASFVNDGSRLVDYLNTELLNGNTTVGFLIRSAGADSTSSMFIGGVDNGTFGPILTVGERNIFSVPNDTVTIIDDSYVAEMTPDSNFNGVTAMQVARDATNGNDRETYLKFPLGDNQTSLVTAILKVRASQENSSIALPDFPIQVFGVTDNGWEEDSITWNNRPPSTTDPLFTFNVQASGNYDWTSAAITDFVRAAIADDRDAVTFVVKGVDNTPGSNVWISDQGFVPASLVYDYRRVAATPTFLTPNNQNYVPSVAVELNAQTPESTIYYTLDGSTPTESDSLYTGPIVLTDTTTITAIAFAEGFAPSAPATRSYNVAPIGLPIFTPSPAVEYTDDLTVTIEIAPADAILLFSLDGSNPITPYPDGGILITETTTIRAQGISTDGLTLGPVAEATYNIVATVAGTGTGPGGVGAADNTISGQPENALWLAANAITGVTDSSAVDLWEDQSGNGNDAFNSFMEGGSNRIPNTGEVAKPAPVLLENGPNGLPVVQFGLPDGSEDPNRNLIVNDADNLDGGAGLSLFVVMKRNELFADFASIVQKRDITSGNAAQSYILEMNGGANPNKLQFVLQRQTFLNSTSEFNATDYYIINTEIQGDFQQGLFRNNGEIESLVNNSLIVPATAAPMILGGFQPLNLAEVILYRSGLNAPQNLIVHNYLATKYDLDITSGGTSARLYTDTEYTKNLIGIGKDTYLETGTEQEHRSASGGGLRIDARTGLAVGTYVMAAHDGTAVTDSANWARYYNLVAAGGNPNVTLSFDFTGLGLGLPADPTTLGLWFSNDGGDTWTDLGLNGRTLDGSRLAFDVDAITSGLYSLSTVDPATSVFYLDNSASLSLYPVPVTDVLTVELENEINGSLDLSVIDALGRTVARIATEKGARTYTANLQIGRLPSGFYTLRVVQDGRYRAVKRFTKN